MCAWNFLVGSLSMGSKFFSERKVLTFLWYSFHVRWPPFCLCLLLWLWLCSCWVCYVCFSRVVAVVCASYRCCGEYCVFARISWPSWCGMHPVSWVPVVLLPVPFRWWGFSIVPRWVVECNIASLSLVAVALLSWSWYFSGWRCEDRTFAVGCGLCVCGLCGSLVEDCSGCFSISPFLPVGCYLLLQGWLSSRWAMRLCILSAWRIVLRSVCSFWCIGIWFLDLSLSV